MTALKDHAKAFMEPCWDEQAVMLSLDNEDLLGCSQQRGALEREDLPLVLVWFKALFRHKVCVDPTQIPGA